MTTAVFNCIAIGEREKTESVSGKDHDIGRSVLPVFVGIYFSYAVLQVHARTSPTLTNSSTEPNSTQWMSSWGIAGSMPTPTTSWSELGGERSHATVCSCTQPRALT